MTERWQDYVQRGLRDAGGPLAAAFEDWRYMAPVLDRIRRHYPPGSRILEIGCGAGLHATLLASWGYDVVASDNDPRIVEQARAMAEDLHVEMEVLHLDALDLPSDLEGFDLAFSLGLIEHFERDVTVDMLRSQARASRTVMAVIPTRYTALGAGITDERIYPLRALVGMFEDAAMRVLDAFAFGDVPNTPGRVMRALLPGPIYPVVQTWTGIGMNLCVFGRAGAARRPR
jgi:SAM-dependent methyltransferase